MKLTEAWLKNPKAQEYFIRTWLPLFLHGRPETFVKHIYSRYATAQNILYMVNFQLPSCTCLDFKKYHWPCKHICALFIYVPGCSFEDLPQTFQNNVFISPDPRYSITLFIQVPISMKMPLALLIQVPIPMKIFQIYQLNFENCLEK